MKIGVITLHRVRNYGSVLQTLATQNYLKKMGAVVEIIDYYPERYTSLGLLKRLKYKSKKLEKNPILLFVARMVISISYIRKKIVFDRFLRKYLELSKITYRNEESLISGLPDADAYCTGSDQVWNSHWNEGIDRPFYLSFIPDGKYRFSYGASIGNTQLENEEKNAIMPLLKKYNHITVREDAGVNVLKDIGIDSEQVLDPTLLFDAEQWYGYTSLKYEDRKYVVTYNLHHDKRIDQYANRIAKKYNLKVYNISYNLHDIVRKGKLMWCPEVEEYLGLIKSAEYVITDSFHATVFSILFHSKFVVIYPEESSSRIRSILNLLDLRSQGFEEMPSLDAVENKIDFDMVDSLLQKERIKTERYIKKIFEEIDNKDDNYGKR